MRYGVEQRAWTVPLRPLARTLTPVPPPHRPHRAPHAVHGAQKTYADAAGEELFAKYQTLIYLAGSASAEFFADIALCPFEAVKVRRRPLPTPKHTHTHTHKHINKRHRPRAPSARHRTHTPRPARSPAPTPQSRRPAGLSSCAPGECLTPLTPARPPASTRCAQVKVQTVPGYAKGITDGMPKFIAQEGLSGWVARSRARAQA